MTQEIKLCSCGDRATDQCPGEWEQGCDLGANPDHVSIHPVDLELARAKAAGVGPSLGELIKKFKNWDGPEVSGEVKPGGKV